MLVSRQAAPQWQCHVKYGGYIWSILTSVSVIKKISMVEKKCFVVRLTLRSPFYMANRHVSATQLVNHENRWEPIFVVPYVILQQTCVGLSFWWDTDLEAL